mmetsp:Transcript_24200/g.58477  ORF Transcript_24200/g.58477 Transcript_24200/m.58477 type:complete len:614 (+) Transcript_24200:22-1863(+)
MSAFPNRYDPSRRRRRRHAPAASHHRAPLTQFATAAAVAYGAYRLGSWAWNAYHGGDDEDKEDKGEGNDTNNNGYEWIGDVRTVERDVRREEGFDSEEESCSEAEDDDEEDGVDDDAGANNDRLGRSRRSRADRGIGRNKPRSHRPSPPEGYHHHGTAIEEQTVEGGDGDGRNDGAIERCARGAAAAATSAGIGIGGAVSAGISAGMRAYDRKSRAGDGDGDDEQERRLRMGRCRLETSRAMADFLPTLRKAIARETDVAPETEELKRLRTKKRMMLEKWRNAPDDRGDDNDTDLIIISDESNEEEEEELREEERRLWNDVKNKSVTRLFATVYAHTIVFLVLTVQVNLLGSRLLGDERREENESMMPGERRPSTANNTSGVAAATTADRYRASHQAVLAKTYHYLFSRGIPSLVKSAVKEVENILQPWDVASGDDISSRDVSAWMDRFRDEMEQRRRHRREDDAMSPLAKFIIPPEGEAETDATVNVMPTDDEDELARFILDETYDVLESPAYANAERACLDATFDHLRTRVFGKLFLTKDEERVLLASVVTHFRKTAVSTFHKPPSHGEEMKGWGGVLGMMEEPLPSMVPNDYTSKLERLDAVLELSNVCF